MTGRILTVALATNLIAVPLTHAYPPERAVRSGRVIHLNWSELQIIARHAKFRRHVRVRIGSSGNQQLKGKLVELTEKGITLKRSNGEEFVSRDEFHSIRFVPAKGNKWRWRSIAGIGGFPIALGAYTLAFAPWGGFPESTHWDQTSFALAVAFVTTYTVYRLA